MKLHAYTDLSIDSRNNEYWKDIVGLEGYFQVSNHGRVKGLERVIKNRLGVERKFPERILKQTQNKSLNRFTGDTRIYLHVSMSFGGKIINYSVPRLVYHTFVAPFDLKDKNTYIFPIDGDTLNTNAANLLLGDQETKQQRMTAAGRKGNVFATISPEQRKAIQQKINAKRALNPKDEISRYSLSGKLLETYHNAEVAAKGFGCSANLLSKATRGKPLTYKNYIWRRGSSPEIDIEEFVTKNGIWASPLSKHIHRIGQYDLHGKLIATFGTIREIEAKLGLNYNQLSGSLNGRHITCGGYLWRYGTKQTINVKKLEKLNGYRHSPIYAENNKISRYDLNGLWKGTYAGVTEASRKTNIDSKTIHVVLRGDGLTAGGYLWAKGEALRLNPNSFKQHPHFEHSLLQRFMKQKENKNVSTLQQRMQSV
ncbi:NUMOD1 domain-containing DNA-binding protein [Pedobacter endophyticus]|uniref:NUMOD1 domain-containing protein n=1 Tax=Pedobacter endophyticus TaxID=2789740 RepID=A0A7S9KY41_9SPHI|nr:NUMOD1 domain-containing DNA-binding protein [Pedobacter endophyticus]QPH38968.1 hypothetical protein IZT61_18180 [Pedobacter endophyticus]